jgi:starch-binding outer membrane protein, SusD/RagB family
MEQRRTQPWSRGLGRAAGLALAGAFLLTTAACDSLLDVDLPGQVEASELDNPGLAETLVLGSVADFECAFTSTSVATGLFADEWWTSSGLRNYNIWGSRNEEVRNFGATACESFTSHGTWRPLQTARFTATDAIERIEGWDPADVPNRDFLIAQAHAYAGYSILLLSETFCEVAFNSGPAESRESGFQRAEQQFTNAIERAQASGHADAANIRQMALVGRARARLNLGDQAGVESDASQVDRDFVHYATYATTSQRRRNKVVQRNNVTSDMSVHPRYRDLEIDGVPDPRVPVEVTGGLGNDNVTSLALQQKFDSEADDKPMATGREAQLMLAEVRGGQAAVDIINDLRSDYDLPEFSSTDEAEIKRQVVEERRRELWMMGTRMGDMLRYTDDELSGLTWETGNNQKGEPYSSLTCIPIQDAERNANPNIS